MEQDGAPPVRLPGNYEGGFAMAAVGAGYHEAFGAKLVAGRGLHAADAGALNEPVVVNEAFMRVVGRNPVGARIRTLQRGSERELGPWHEIVGVVTDLGMLFPADWGGGSVHLSRSLRRGARSRRGRCARRGGRSAACAPGSRPCAAGRCGSARPRYRHPRRYRCTGAKADGGRHRRLWQRAARGAGLLRGAVCTRSWPSP